MLEVQVAVAKTHKYASNESGDTVELVERPHGGLSVLLVDAQGSGLAAKTISNLIINRGAALIKDGIRDGAVARAVHDYLYTLRQGKVSATLDIVSVDLQSRSLLVSRNDEGPSYFFSKKGVVVEGEAVTPIGIYLRTKPVIVEYLLDEYIGALVVSDGVTHAGSRRGKHMDVAAFVTEQLAGEWPHAQALVDALVARAVELDEGRPCDDISAVVVMIVPSQEGEAPVRQLQARFPIE